MDVGLINHLRFDHINWTRFLVAELTRFGHNQRSVLTGLCVKQKPTAFFSFSAQPFTTHFLMNASALKQLNALQTWLISLLKYLGSFLILRINTIIHFLIFKTLRFFLIPLYFGCGQEGGGKNNKRNKEEAHGRWERKSLYKLYLSRNGQCHT